MAHEVMYTYILWFVVFALAVVLALKYSLLIHPQTHSKWDNAVTSHSQHVFMRRKSCLTNLISLYDKVTHLVDQRKP